MRKLWINEEMDILREMFSNTTSEMLMELLPNRSLYSIKMKAKKLGLRRNKEFTKRIQSENTRGVNNPMYGKKSPRYGVKLSVETKNKISKSRIDGFKNGSIKPLNGAENPMYGSTPYNKGRKIHEIHSEEKCIEIRNKMSNSRKEYWESLTDKEREIQILRCINNFKLQTLERFESIPEQIVRGILENNKISFEQEKEIVFYTCDFVIGDKIIEIQGDYWHANPNIYDIENINYTQTKNVNRDKSKKTFLDKKYNLLYLWEHDIKNNHEETKTKILNFLNDINN